MPRFNFPGDVHFVTFRTDKSYPYFKDNFKDKRCCELFLENLEFYWDKYNLKIYGFVILWDHVHLLIEMDFEKFPEVTISKVMHGIKGYSSKVIYKYLQSQERDRQGSYALPGNSQDREDSQGTGALASNETRFRVWQPSFYDYNINTKQKFREKLNYIHKNPIKHGLVKDIEQYKFCSWQNYELNDHSTFKINYFEY